MEARKETCTQDREKMEHHNSGRLKDHIASPKQGSFVVKDNPVAISPSESWVWAIIWPFGRHYHPLKEFF